MPKHKEPKNVLLKDGPPYWEGGQEEDSDMLKVLQRTADRVKAGYYPNLKQNDLIGRLHPGDSDYDQYNPYSPLADLLYQRDRAVERANVPYRFRDETKSPIEFAKKANQGGYHSPRYEGYAIPEISEINDIDTILAKRENRENNQERFNQLKKVIDASRKKMFLKPVEDIK